MADPLSIAARLAAVEERIAAACARAGRRRDAVRLVAVSKGVTAERLGAAIAAGLRTFGENYVQEWRAKREALADGPPLDWHFIGRLQRNKAGAVAEAACVHSLADERIGAALARAAAARGTRLPALVQVNVAGEASKEGVAPVAVPALLAALRRHDGLAIVGLMTMPPPGPAAAMRPYFGALRALRDRQEDAGALGELSMGMSGDFEVAIEEGATMVRIGTAIFGPRRRQA